MIASNRLDEAKPLTARQGQVLGFILAHVRRTGIQPAWRDILAYLKCKSPNLIYELITALARKGYVRQSGGRGRALDILRTPDGRRLVRAGDRDALAEMPLVHLHRVSFANDESGTLAVYTPCYCGVEEEHISGHVYHALAYFTDPESLARHLANELRYRVVIRLDSREDDPIEAIPGEAS